MKREDSDGMMCGKKRHQHSDQLSGEDELERAVREERHESREDGIIHSQEDGEDHPPGYFGEFNQQEEAKLQVRQSDEIIKVKEEVTYKTEQAQDETVSSPRFNQRPGKFMKPTPPANQAPAPYRS